MDIDISMIGMRVMDEIVKPLCEIDIDDTEFACLKAIVFFDPSKYSTPYLYKNTMSSVQRFYKDL